MATFGVPARSHPTEISWSPSPALRRVGGIIALANGLFLVWFLVLFFLVLPSLGFQTSYFDDPPRFIAFVTSHYALYFWTSLIGVVVVATLILLVQALGERTRAAPAALARVATSFGAFGSIVMLLNWLFQYATMRVAGSAPAVAVGYQQGAGVVFNMTNMGAFLTLGLWIALVSWAALRYGGLPRAVSYLGLLTSLVNLLVLFDVPFGVVLTALWFIAVGAILLFGRPAAVNP